MAKIIRDYKRRFLIASIISAMLVILFLASDTHLHNGASRRYQSSNHHPQVSQSNESFFLFLKENSTLDKPTTRKPILNKHRRSKDAPRAVLLWTTWRSGSNHIGELLANAVPNTFYSYEPLHWMGVQILHRKNRETSRAIKFLHNLLYCRLDSFMMQITYRSYYTFDKKWNPYLMKKCEPLGTCFNPAYVSKVCLEANMHFGKVLRLSLKFAWALLQDDELDLQIIYLARDPRASLASRKRAKFCTDTTCGDATKVCDMLEDDLHVASKMLEEYPEKFKLVQYERFSIDAEQGLKDLMLFLGFPSLSQMQMDLLHPKTLGREDLFGMQKNSSMMIDRWRTNTDFTSVSGSQLACAKPLFMLGLRIFKSEEEFRNLSLPLLVTNIMLD
ncbi:carbohydrate sulfotransferase 5-like [Palaemon carinicauda]|uniref:carbohydrate sulfotransferase 5-like n=1 Tax=Palaemon carinicauda TaxID=392227 RepID=UPI0035B599FE